MGKIRRSRGTRRDKLLYISDFTLSMFRDALDRGSIVHDIDIRKWALEAKENIDLSTFKAGKWWIFKFKKLHAIVSRKITKFVTYRERENSQEINTVIDNFIQVVKPNINSYGVENVFNSDESGFNLELHSGRTLAAKGSKTIEVVVQSISSTTHSYTIQPTVSANGKLLSPLYIVLKESSGQFGPRVKESLFNAPNVHVSASKSGKLISEHFKTWFTEIFLTNVGSRSVRLLDSWSGHCPNVLQNLVPEGKEVLFLTIPKKTTERLQPLDIFGFRIWKNFVETFSDQVILLNHDVILHQRNNIIKLQSLVHNQLSSPRFQNLFKHSWYKSGYMIEERPERYENPVDYCSKM
ncbi:LOW QUALITY PROTEIN: uncharacterized protein LOC143305331 [Osmia lignaria lignaria]|uniref:LOW QUALITY PROTEIN: uncharacterized protein LOC143305331 n=1 Tax=Osmia lignaria lignaria TaxID=1437193 RepID=UPI00402B3924